MKRTLRTLSLAALCLLAGPAVAEEPSQTAKGPIDTFLEGCKVELETYCKEVTPGEGRLLACIFAHEDKLSNRCEYALYDAAEQLERAVSALTYVAKECEQDLAKHCAEVEVGEGRLLDCLEKHEQDVSDRCLQALKDVGLKE
ncbi:MAG: cysteine rich repeat-containing protein [Gammaproteobacteria bacterium]